MRPSLPRKKFSAAARLCLGVAAFAISAPAFAADIADDNEAGASQQDIIVTGSRIARRDFVSDSPITTVSDSVLKNTGELTLDKSLAQLPQFGRGENATQTGYNTTGQASVNLRGLGTFRNLVLMDGRRLMPSNIQQVVDLNTIPTALVESIEVITGGASAVYGSDAIAGVVNVKTKQRFTGLQFDGQYGISGQGDGATSEVSLTGGVDFAGGRGNIVVSGSYAERSAIRYQSRAFFRKNQGGTDLRLPTGVYDPGSNGPSQAALDDVFGDYGVNAGLVTPSSGISFNEDGSLFSASGGVHNYKGSQGGLLYSTGQRVNNLNTYLTHQAPMQRYSGFARATFDLTDDVTIFAQGNYSEYDTRILVEPGNTSLTLRTDNPFISPELATLLASRADPDADFTVHKRFNDAGPRVTERNLQTYQLLGGLRGKLEAIDGSWEIYGSHGRTKIHERSPGSVLASSLRALTQAADGGQSLCDGGYNPFGNNALSADCAAYLVAAPVRDVTLKQDAVEANFQGKLADLPAGEARFAAGVSYRSNSYVNEPDAILSAGNVVGVPFTRYSEGSSNVKEAFVELLLPVVKEKPFFHSLDISAGYRYSHYNLAGGAHTYKADANWSPVKAWNIRGGYARAVRAPSVGELFAAPSGSTPALGRPEVGEGDLCNSSNAIRNGANAAQVRELCLAQGVPLAQIDNFVNPQDDSNATSVGNLNLKPEVADTYTIGTTLTPRFSTPWFQRLNLSVDYYDIRVKGAIGVVSSKDSVQKCFNLSGDNPTYSNDNFFCQNITRDANGRIENVDQPTLNLGGYRTRGIDMQVDWQIGLDAIGIQGNKVLNINSVITYLDSFKLQTTPGGSFTEYAGSIGGAPNALPTWKAVTTISYGSDVLNLGARWRFLSDMEASARRTNPLSSTPGVPSYSLFDLFGSVKVSDDFTLRGGINNVANKQPLVLNGTIGTTDPSSYDVIGRSLFIAATAKF